MACGGDSGRQHDKAASGHARSAAGGSSSDQQRYLVEDIHIWLLVARAINTAAAIVR